MNIDDIKQIAENTGINPNNLKIGQQINISDPDKKIQIGSKSIFGSWNPESRLKTCRKDINPNKKKTMPTVNLYIHQ